jgi:hypothetical protein
MQRIFNLRSIPFFLVLAILTGAYCSRSGAGKANTGVRFNFQVRPILSDRCFKCHGPDEKQRKAGLRLDTREGAMAALGERKDHYAIVPGHPESSTLVHRIYSTNPDSIMPSPDSHLTLTEDEKSILKTWVAEGAQWERHWSFVVPQKPAVPTVNGKDWPVNEIDHFILAKQEEKGIEHNAPADKARLARRVAFTLTGLPPAPALLERFLADDSDNAYPQLVDSLLASPAYGERWAVYWLDLARYSDTHGYQDDLERVMWPWRDWVIKAFNENMPYDRFATWQLAGDLLPAATPEMVLATGFNRNHKITQEGGVIDEEYRLEYVSDRTNTFGKAFLGLTMECARCHDHKYDPISAREYYATSAFFNKVPEVGFVPNLATPKPYVKIQLADVRKHYPFMNAESTLKTENDSILLMVMHDSVGLRKTHILTRGQYDRPGAEVREDLVASVLPFDTAQYARDRKGMAEWLFDARHPLTARVMVNRLWQEVFGRGIVATTDNFGLQGALPSHPELLDWLAVDFRENGWDMKRALRQMVCSATFRQSAQASDDHRNKDPENNWLARGPRFRLHYEFIRDNALAASGLLVRQLGGPSVKPYQPDGIWDAIAADKTANNFRGENSYTVDTLPERLYRRSLYTYNRRTIPPPTALAFDSAPRDVCEVSRSRTSTPLQALVMLNDPQVLEASRVLAGKLLQGTPAAKDCIARAFSAILTRPAESKELALLAGLYESEYERFRQEPKRAKKVLEVGHYPQVPVPDVPMHAALMLTVGAIFNLDEAMY